MMLGGHFCITLLYGGTSTSQPIMSLCINPRCSKPSDPFNANNIICRNCGSQLLLQQRYRVIRLLSDKSSFGAVYEADDRGEPKILKVLKAHLNSQPKAVELFQKEAFVLSQLRHPGIPRVEEDGYFTFLPRDGAQVSHCLVMERIEGLNLEEWMNERRNQPITQEQALDWLTQITQILDQVHQQDYFHRDIKPPNIMWQPNGQLVLIDFGTAREVTGTYLAKIGGSQNVTGIVSVGYTPPEQAGGRAVPQSDFYALGRTFVYLLTGKHPNDFPEDPITGELIWQDTANPVSKSLANLIDYLMAPFPGNRPQNTQVILKHLAEIEQILDSPGSHSELLQEQPLELAVPSSRPSEPIQSQALSTNQSKQQRRLLPKFDSNKWLAGSTVMLMGLGGIGYWQFTQKPLLSTAAITNTSPSSQPNSGQFPMKSQERGVRLEVLSVSKQGESVLLNVKLKNEGANSVRFDYKFFDVTDDRDRTLFATTDGLPQELPNGQEVSGTVTVPTALWEGSRTLSLTLTDYPDRRLQLKILKIPVAR
jgi:serine/threonine protein kinase